MRRAGVEYSQQVLNGVRVGTKVGRNKLESSSRPRAMESMGWDPPFADDWSTRSHRMCHDRVKRPLNVLRLPSRFEQFDGNPLKFSRVSLGLERMNLD